MGDNLTEKELITLAHEQGANAGQIALSEFLLKAYKGQMSTKLETFLAKVANDGYEGVAKNLDMPAEDVALEVSQIIDKVVH